MLSSGVMTIATMAALNVAGHRLHELTDGKYTYLSPLAHTLRGHFSATPAILVVVFALFGVLIHQAHDTAKVLGSEIEQVGTFVWASIAYIVSLVAITVYFSREIYRALRPYDRGD